MADAKTAEVGGMDAHTPADEVAWRGLQVQRSLVRFDIARVKVCGYCERPVIVCQLFWSFPCADQFDPTFLRPKMIPSPLAKTAYTFASICASKAHLKPRPHTGDYLERGMRERTSMRAGSTAANRLRYGAADV